MKRLCIPLLALLLGAAYAQGELEIFSWWAGDEGPAFQALIDEYQQEYE